jgi:hypothetical protein
LRADNLAGRKLRVGCCRLLLLLLLLVQQPACCYGRPAAAAAAAAASRVKAEWRCRLQADRGRLQVGDRQAHQSIHLHGKPMTNHLGVSHSNHHQSS